MTSAEVLPRKRRSIDKQPEMNLVSLGAVANGKSSLVEAMTGKYTPQHSKEQKQGITINLGYAGLKIWKCPKCPEPECYQGTSSEIMEKRCHFESCQSSCELQRHFSIVDCPGHESLMATMLGGAAVMDAGILLMAVNNKMPESQTRDHMIAASVLGADQFVVCLNKWDLLPLDGNKIKEKYTEAIEFMEYAGIENAPIVPIAAKKKINVDVVLEYLCTQLNPVPRDITCEPLMIVLRSFNNNNPGVYNPVKGLIGGILGGALMKGTLKIDDEIEIRPGKVQLNPNNNEHNNNTESKFIYQPIKSRVISLNTEQISLEEAYPGGLVGVKTTLDPALTKNNQLVGSIIGKHGFMPYVYEKIVIKYNILKHLSDENKKFKKIAKGTRLLVNIHSAQVTGIVTDVPEKKHIEITFDNIPVCIPSKQRVPISMEIERKWKLVGSGIFISGTESKCLVNDNISQ